MATWHWKSAGKCVNNFPIAAEECGGGGGKVEGSDNNSLIHLNRNKQETKYEGQLGVEQTIENNWQKQKTIIKMKQMKRRYRRYRQPNQRSVLTISERLWWFKLCLAR